MLFLSIVLLILILGFLIFIHELGHFLFAKLGGAAVTDFSIGIGPSLFKIKWLDTPVNLRLFPLGGYVSLIGEVQDEGPGSFVRLSIIKQVSVILGGIIFNVIVAILLTSAYLGLLHWQVYMPISLTPKYAEVQVSDSFVLINKVTNDSSLLAVKEELKDFPVLLKVGNTKIVDVNQLKQVLKQYKDGDSVNITLASDDVTKTRQIKVLIKHAGKLGILVYEIKSGYWNYKNIPVLARPLAYMYDFSLVSYEFLKSAIADAIYHHNTQVLKYSIGGPISILPVLSSTLASVHPVVQIIGIIGLLSLNLALINAIPFPGLDGWHILLIVFRKLIPSQRMFAALKYVTYGGLLILLLLAVIITIKDLNLVIGLYGK